MRARGVLHILSFVCLLLFAVKASFYPQLASASKDPPFEPGETLTFEVKWDPPWWLPILPGTYYVGDISIKVVERTNQQGREAFKLVAEAKSSGVLAKIARINIDDYFESWLDAEDLCSRRIYKRIREGKRQKDIITIIHSDQQRLHIRELDVSKDPPEEKRNEFVDGIPHCVQDVVSAFYAARIIDFKMNQPSSMVIADDGKIKEVRLIVLKREPVKTYAGEFDTIKIQTVAVFGGLFKGGGQFYVWLSDNEHKIPVKFDARVRLGRVFGELKKLSQKPLTAEKQS